MDYTTELTPCYNTDMDHPTPLWACPKCGQKFVTKNLAHSCTIQSVDDFFETADPAIREIYETFVKKVEEICGKVLINVNKTRISLQTRTRLASINGFTKEGLKVHLVTTQKLTSPRFTKTQKFDKAYVHNFILTSSNDIDDEVSAWIKEAYKYGEQ